MDLSLAILQYLASDTMSKSLLETDRNALFGLLHTSDSSWVNNTRTAVHNLVVSGSVNESTTQSYAVIERHFRPTSFLQVFVPIMGTLLK